MFNWTFWKTLRFWLGLLLAVGAAVAIFVVAKLANPEPVGVLIAARDIQPYEIVTQEDVRVDWQHIHPLVAEKLLTRDEADQVLGRAVALDPLYAGEPIAKARLAVGRDPSSVQRISAAVDEGWVVLTIPVNPDRAPDPALFPGDVVVLIASFGSNVPDVFSQGPTQEETVYYGASATAPTYNWVTPMPSPFTLRLPAAKAMGVGVVVRVEREMIPNPSYQLSVGGGEEGSTQPRYIEGDVTHLVVLVPVDRLEQLDFAMRNGEINVAILPATAREWAETGQDLETFGYTWDDFNAEFLATRGVTTTMYLDPEMGVIMPPPTPMPEAEAETAPSTPSAEAGETGGGE